MALLHFTLNFQTEQKRKLERFIEEFLGTVGSRAQSLSIDRYDKISNQMQARFEIETDTLQKEVAVYEMLSLANKLCNTRKSRWTFLGPYDEGNLSFECILNHDNESHPLKWAHIELLSLK
jgi:hypothetical protein